MKISLFFIICLLSVKGICQKDTFLFKNQKVTIFKDSAYYKDTEIYNAAKDLKELTKQEKTDDCDVNYQFYYNPLSLVGNYYSYESGEAGTIACGPSGNSLEIQTINLSNRQPVSILDIFTEKSILKALKNDNWVKKITQEYKIDLNAINSFKTFLDTINNLGSTKFSSNSFTLLSYNKQNKNASVRFVGMEYMGFNHYKHLQLGLLLEPKKAYLKLFKNKIHFTLTDFKNGLTK
ncbi:MULTISPECIES: hypothetical protein [unclassified Cellulophaga]|uniref:hypothetical protein n=1 Tax=unclassified Cellulophaga TaxID=2634405 RepID=UPI0026E3C1B4|nr:MULTISPECIES: hypothetical protein [unclassified Cellulophaga]MDO6492873.1 hypothetical protein [Cellulophaga sp. 2_MG-2023]MDO6496375.1 hypothetical protein [Cellulophaga sp. 3_MG-2023]